MWRKQHGSFCGFTLIEVVCVLFIIGLISALCLPQLKKLRVEDTASGETKIICDTLKDARYRSITEGVAYDVLFKDERIWLKGEEKSRLSPVVTFSTNLFWFYPSGKATPGEIMVDDCTIIVSVSGRLKIEKTRD
ncbi:prepilin-type N-terminal cleavage/methylation domain-containing protein [Candidatus Desantisbacteria bacterium]|nr:prepilin-type N-terminal cleavage/methylation domain-containing protein [Candidatus Desantisbacteria bacterium]